MNQDSFVLENQQHVPIKNFKKQLRRLLSRIWIEIPPVLHSHVINYLHSSYEDEYSKILEEGAYSFHCSFHIEFSVSDIETATDFTIVAESKGLSGMTIWSGCSGFQMPVQVFIDFPTRIYLQ